MADSSVPGWITLAALGLVGLLAARFLFSSSPSGENDAIRFWLLMGGDRGMAFEAGKTCKNLVGPDGAPISVQDYRDCQSIANAASGGPSGLTPVEGAYMNYFLKGYYFAGSPNPYGAG